MRQFFSTSVCEKMIEVACVSNTRSTGGKSFILHAGALDAFSAEKASSQNSGQSHVQVRELERNDAWPIQVMATSPCFNFGRRAGAGWPWRGVEPALQDQLLEKKCAGEMLRRVSPERARPVSRRGAGRLDFSFVIRRLEFSTPPAHPANLKN